MELSPLNLNEKINHSHGVCRFSSIAKYLLNQATLRINDTEAFLTEIEFYYKGIDHNDLDIHQDDEQFQSNTFYIHSKGRGGIDITFGNGKDHGGILIRGIKLKDQPDQYIDGPLNVYKYFCDKLDVTTREDLRTKITNITICLNEDRNEDIYQGPRIGLVNQNNEYSVHPYRYLIDLNTKHKFREKSNVYAYSIKLNLSNQEKLKKIIGYNFDIEKYKQILNSSTKQRNKKKYDFIK